MIIANIIAMILVVIGSLNWGIVGIFNYNLVTAIFGAATVGAIITYIIIMIAAIWLVISLFIARGRLLFNTNEER